MVLQLHWSGETNKKIAALTSYTEQQVCNIITSDEGQAILQQLTEQTLDAHGECSQIVQAVLPAIVDEAVRLALSSTDEKVRTANCHKLMGIGGLTEVKRVQVESGDSVVEKNKDKTDDELRNQLLSELGIQPQSQTIH